MNEKSKIHQLDLNLLKVFKALYAEQNMTRAADILHLTPSAVSHAIKRLRYTLNDELFVRSQNKMVPTPACERIAPVIIENLTRLQQALQQWGVFDAEQSECHFRIGIHYALEPSVVPQLTKLLREKAPNVEFSSVKFKRADIDHELASGKIDLAIDIAIPTKAQVKHWRINDSEFVVLMRHDHPCYGKLDQESYLKAEHITVSNRPSGITAEDTLFDKIGIQRRSYLRCQNYYSAREIVLTSDQLLTLPKVLALRLLNDDCVMQPLPFDIKSFPISLYWHESVENDAALSWLRTLVQEHVSLD